MKSFEIAYNITLGHEGVYSNDADDKGGETYKGIARRHWPLWEGWKIIDIYTTKYSGSELNRQLAGNDGLQGMVKEFYYQNFWLPLGGDSFHQEIANEIFDTGVNQGKYAAATYLQLSLNKLNRNQKDFKDLHVDGQIGYNSKAAYEAYMSTERFASRNSEKLIKWLLKWMNFYQLKKYESITTKNSVQEKFIPGWTERV